MRRTALRALSGVVAALVALEVVLQLLPVSTAARTAYHFDPDLLTYPAHHRWRVSTGWDLRNTQSLRSNNFGFVADRDFVPDPRAVAVIGDSYVEASMLEAPDRPGAQLQRLLPDRPVYALGGPGSSLLDYAQRVRWASEQLKVRDFVLLLEQFDARQAVCGSGNVHSRCIDPATFAPSVQRRAPAGPLTRALRHSALAQYLAGQVRFRPDAFARAMFSRMTPEKSARLQVQGTAPTAQEIAAVRARVDAVVDNFQDTVRPFVTGRLIVLVDGRRTHGSGQDALDDAERRHLMERLRAGGADVVDLEPVYARHAAHSARRLDVGPYDGHLNMLGVALVMAQAAGALAQ